MRQSIKILSLPLLLLFLIPAAACAPGEGDESSVKVVASIYPLGYFAERIGDDLVEVEVLVGPGVEAHAFEPATSHLRSIEAADVIVMNGLELEPWLERALEALGDDAAGIVVEAADATQAMEGFVHVHEEDEHEGEDHEEDAHEGEDHEEDAHEGEDHEEDAHEGDEEDEHHGEELDPHMWLDPKLAVVQVERIRDALVAVDADNAEGYRERADALIAELNELHADFEAGLAACKHDHFVTSHAAYGYLAARYSIEQIPVAGLSPEAEPSPQQLAEITDEVTELGLSYVLVEPVLAESLVETVARETGAELLPIHVLESVTEGELEAHGDYLGLMRDNLASLRLALECS